MKIAIIGYGAYGKATSKLLCYSGNDICCLTNDKNVSSTIICDNIKITNDYKTCLKDASIIYVLTPAINTPEVFNNIAPYVNDNTIIVLGSKGILDNAMLIEDVLKAAIPGVRYACISGPTFARDIDNLNPIGFTLATKSIDDFKFISSIYKNVNLEYSADTTGVELCGVLKNAYAIGSGIINGLDFGESTRALYIIKIIEEMKVILSSLGADENTVYTLAGLGDTILSCTSNTSRNYTFGNLVCKNFDEAQIYLKSTTVEGYGNIRILYDILHEKNIEVPILNAIYEIVFNKIDAKEIIIALTN